jgi:F0F1-type ATP synthase membrane subunit b/b'
MTVAEFIWTSMILLALILLLGFIVYKIIHLVRRQREDPIPPKIHKASHELRNEVTKLRAGLRWAQKEDDPISALMRAAKGERDYHARDH